MTTLTYSHKDKQIAIDSRISSNGTIRSDSHNKIIRNNIGTWFFTGKCCDEIALSKLYHNDHVKIIPEASALLINNEAVYYVCVNDEGYCEWFEVDHDCAYGSGQDFAIAALDFGKTATEAIEYAITRDIYTGGNIQCVNVINKNREI